MSDKLQPSVPRGAPFDSQFPKEESHVRCHDTGKRPSESGTHAVSLPSDGAEPQVESVGERTSRIDGKIRDASAALARLSPTDGRARLLASAVLRRDEVLLDAVLAQLARDSAPPTSSRGGS
mgnify:CR=1 FL=1